MGQVLVLGGQNPDLPYGNFVAAGPAKHEPWRARQGGVSLPQPGAAGPTKQQANGPPAGAMRCQSQSGDKLSTATVPGCSKV